MSAHDATGVHYMANDEQIGEHSHPAEQALRPNSIMDSVIFGRRLRALRILEGFDRGEDFCNVLTCRFGIDISLRTLYAIERGEQMPHFDFVVACIVALKATPDYFAPAFRSDAAAYLFHDRARA